MAHPTGKASPPALSSHMIKHHLRHRAITTHVEGGERDRELRLAGALENENGELRLGLIRAASHGDMGTLKATLPFFAPRDAGSLPGAAERAAERERRGESRRRPSLCCSSGAPTRCGCSTGEPAVVVAAACGNAESLETIVNHGVNNQLPEPHRVLNR